MDHWFFGGLLAAVLGLLVSYISYLISRKTMTAKPELAGAVGLPRQLLQIGLLAAVYLLTPMTPWGRTETLVGAVIGMTAGMFVFTARLLKDISPKGPETTERGDENG